jgi:ribosome-associated protein
MNDNSNDRPDEIPSAREKKQKLRLDQFLKLKGMVSTGGEAKVRIQSGEVLLNGEVCLLRGRGLRVGDVVELEGSAETVGEDLFV